LPEYLFRNGFRTKWNHHRVIRENKVTAKPFETIRVEDPGLVGHLEKQGITLAAMLRIT